MDPQLGLNDEVRIEDGEKGRMTSRGEPDAYSSGCNKRLRNFAKALF
jgi:hypothetical protein